MRGKSYTVYSIVTTLLEEAALAGVVLWLLPRFGINIPLWGLCLFMAALGAYNYITYRLYKKTLAIESPSPTQALIGCQGKTTTALEPEGSVRVQGELWRARATEPTIKQGDEVVVVGVEGLTLFVAHSVDSNHRADEANALPR